MFVPLRSNGITLSFKFYRTIAILADHILRINNFGLGVIGNTESSFGSCYAIARTRYIAKINIKIDNGKK